MIYGYARCSTDETKQDVERQTRELRAAGVKEKNIFFEYESGMKVQREKLNALLDKVQAGDTILATETSRITRSTKQLCEIIEFAKERKIKLILGSFVVDCTKEVDPVTEGMLMMMGVFSELERNMIRQRILSGMENAKANGKKLGRPPIEEKDIPQVFKKYYPMYKEGQINKKELSRLTSLSYPSVYKYLRILESKGTG